MKHTPGPWGVATQTNPNGYCTRIEIWGAELVARDVTAQNACLIAAAPDLAEALKDARAYITHLMASPYNKPQMLARIEAALAKAGIQ